jgi:hypothetical protein
MMGAAGIERLGTKWTCFSCGVRFYDLAKEVAVCPRCSSDQRDAPPTPPPAAAKPKRKAAAKRKR